jgi:hypothetical protein
LTGLRLGQPIPDWVWHEPQIQTALAERDLTTVYRHLFALGLSQGAIGLRSHQKQPDVSEVIHGRRVVAYDVLVRIADGLGIPRGYLGLAHCGPTKAAFADAAAERPAEPPAEHVIARVVTVGVARCARCGDTTVPAVPKWTTREIRALMQATRMGVRAFARELGLTARTVAKWTAPGSTMIPRHGNQETLDAMLRLASPEARALFVVLLDAHTPAALVERAAPPEAGSAETVGGRW